MIQTFRDGTLGRKPECCARCQPFGRRSHEPYVALLDEIPEGQAHPAKLLCDRDNESQVLLDERGPPLLVALPRPPAEIYLLLVCKEPSMTDLL
jgi:hypothetical protein